MKSKTYILLASIFFVALYFRLIQLADVPYGFHIDEVKAGWNSYSILQTGRDDKGNFLPLYYDSFGDFRPAGLIYLMVPSLLIFGKTVFAVRFPFALIGALSIIPIYLFSNEIFYKKFRWVGIYSAILLALNPWHIVVSRSTSESVIAIFLSLFGLYFFIKLSRSSSKVNLFLSLVFIVLSFFFYHNIRILAPIFLICIIIFNKAVLKSVISKYQIVVFLLILLLSTIIFISPESKARMNQVSIKSDFKVLYETVKMPNEEGPGHVLEARIFHNRISAYIRRFAEEYKDYFSLNFLAGITSRPVRYNVPQVGLLTYFEILFFTIGLFYVSKNTQLILLLLLLTIAPLTGAVTIEDVPNMQRSIFMLPFLIIVAGFGYSMINELPRRWNFLLIIFAIGYVCNFVYFYHMYFAHQKHSIATYFRNGGAVELIGNITKIKNNYSFIVMTNSTDNLYPWVAFLSYDDSNYFNSLYQVSSNNVKRVDKFVFSNDKCPSQNFMQLNQIPDPQILFVDSEGCVYTESEYKNYIINTVDIVRRPDGSPPFYLRTLSKNLLTTPNNKKN